MFSTRWISSTYKMLTIQAKKRIIFVMTSKDKIIIAIATAYGTGAIGIIRISGEGCFEKVASVFSGFNREETNVMKYGTLLCGDYTDRCMGVFFKGPHSYTGEDSVELYCHGSYALMSGIVRYFVENKGFCYAEGGDFTARAFSNGRIDLTEAEGIYDLICAESEAEIRGAFSLITGRLRKTVEKIQGMIISARAATEAAIDYPEEDVEERSAEEVKKELLNIKNELDSLISTYKTGKIMRSGISVALIGKPNVGKSSLMNAMLGYERAIVTDEKGTTRDTLTEGYIYKGISFNVTDTAGIREASTLSEKKGIERAEKAAMESDVACVVFEAGEDASYAEKRARELLSDGRRVVLVENKTDIKRAEKRSAIAVSALTGEGIDRLKEKIYELSGASLSGGAQLNNERQLSAAMQASEHIERALDNIDASPIELISADLYDAYAALGKITGITGSDALAEEIFKRFCVGK